MLPEKANSIHFKQGHLHYIQWGNGPKVLLAFHGFGQTAHAFKSLAKAIEKEYTCYSFDLFYHGNSQWYLPGQVLTKETWKEVVQLFLAAENISRFSVCGFSIGSRLALATLEAFTNRVEHLYLIAPDGIYTNPWYYIATSTQVGKAAFKILMQYPAPITRTSLLLQRLGLLHKKLGRFAESQLQTPAQRHQLYHTWLGLSKLRFVPKALAHLLNSSPITLTVFLGADDKVVTQKKLQLFLKQVKKAEVHVLRASHTRLIQATAAFLTPDNKPD